MRSAKLSSCLLLRCGCACCCGCFCCWEGTFDVLEADDVVDDGVEAAVGFWVAEPDIAGDGGGPHDVDGCAGGGGEWTLAATGGGEFILVKTVALIGDIFWGEEDVILLCANGSVLEGEPSSFDSSIYYLLDTRELN